VIFPPATWGLFFLTGPLVDVHLFRNPLHHRPPGGKASFSLFNGLRETSYYTSGIVPVPPTRILFPLPRVEEFR